jgi:hypothetical protein
LGLRPWYENEIIGEGDYPREMNKTPEQTILEISAMLTCMESWCQTTKIQLDYLKNQLGVRVESISTSNTTNMSLKKKPDQHPNRGKKWSTQEDKSMQVYLSSGLTMEEAATRLGRSRHAIWCRLRVIVRRMLRNGTSKEDVMDLFKLTSQELDSIVSDFVVPFLERDIVSPDQVSSTDKTLEENMGAEPQEKDSV